MAEQGSSTVLQLAPFQSMVDEGFWHRLSSLKLNELGIDDSPISITGFYAPCSRSQVSNHLTLLTESLPTARSEQSSEISLVVAIEIDKEKRFGKTSIQGMLRKNSALLSRFLVISFADLKKWSFHYWFAFPALALKPPAALVDLKKASQYFSPEEAQSVSAACNAWRNSSLTADIPFFLVSVDSNSQASIRGLHEWDACHGEKNKLLYGFYDPCHLPNNPGWPLRNFLALICARWNQTNVKFFCYRESRGFADMELSLVGEAHISVTEDWRRPENLPDVVGWELNKGKRVPRCISLAQSMDPTRLAVSAADLNLKLMRWRALPSLDLDTLFGLKCLLLGAGTLGCQVARMLMAWGVRKITLVDNGRVAMSNPLRQSLYTLDDCLNGGEFKATAAVKSLQRIFPAVEAEGVIMAIPMPGHPVPKHLESSMLDDCRHLNDLINKHDAVFLLTDTRESRWLPTLLCANANKITITAALGFDSFLVMRHGAGPLNAIKKVDADPMSSLSADLSKTSVTDEAGAHRLGCYFCNDVVAPIDSTTNRTLDQQCTVTRPGLAPITSALAVELLVGILHHPDRIYAEGEVSNSTLGGHSEQPLGILPHQIRGSLSQFSQMTLLGRSSNSCTACSTTVVNELTELMKSASEFNLDWDNDDDDADCIEI
ncbi:unnamed protein product [Rhodiola kirilowii]